MWQQKRPQSFTVSSKHKKEKLLTEGERNAALWALLAFPCARARHPTPVLSLAMPRLYPQATAARRASPALARRQTPCSHLLHPRTNSPAWGAACCHVSVERRGEPKGAGEEVEAADACGVAQGRPADTRCAHPLHCWLPSFTILIDACQHFAAGIQREEEKVRRSIKDAAKRNDTATCKMLAPRRRTPMRSGCRRARSCSRRSRQVAGTASMRTSTGRFITSSPLRRTST